MLNPISRISVNYKDVAFDKEYRRNIDIEELVRRLNALHNQLIESNIKLRHLQSENKRLKEQIKSEEFRSIIK